MNGNTLDKFYIAAVKLQERGTRIVHSLEKDNGVSDYEDIDNEIERTLCIKIQSIQGAIEDLIEYMDNNDL